MYIVKKLDRDVKPFVIYNIDGFGDMAFVVALNDEENAYQILEVLRADEKTN